MTKFINDVVGLEAYELFRPNVAVMEQQETQALVNQGQEDLAVQADVPPEDAE
jgi:hypothetical protein